MQYKPSKWVSGYKHGPAASYTQITRMGLFLNVATSKFEPLDSTWDNLFAASTDGVGIGASSPSRSYGATGQAFLEIQGSQNPGLVIYDTGQDYEYQFVAQAAHVQLRYGDTSTGKPLVDFENSGDVEIRTGNLVISTAGKGIDFSAQTATATGTTTSELLDHYEEGTFTPVVSDGTNNATMNSTYEDHYYTRIGRVVHCTGYLATDGMGSVSGDLRITGLPFTVGAKYSASCGAYGSGMVITAGQTVGLRVIPSQTYAYLTIWDATAGTTQLTSTQWDDGAMMISFTYTV